MMNSWNLDQLTSNKNALVAVAAGGSVLALCGGFLTMALTTVGILGKAAAVGEAEPAQPVVQQTRPTTSRPTQPIAGDPAERALQTFMARLQDGQWEEAYKSTTSDNRARYTDEEFRKLMEKYKLRDLRNWSASVKAQTRKTRTLNVKVVLDDNSDASFTAEMFIEDDGWHVNRFEK
jgi:hypothetical protein